MNDRIGKCPRCRKLDCPCDERKIANAMSRVNQGVSNLDVCLHYRWVHSQRRVSRTAIVELKQEGEGMRMGQELALLDLTGTLETAGGYRFEQRTFVIERRGKGFRLSTSTPREEALEPRWMPLVAQGAVEQCAEAIQAWVNTGVLHFVEEPIACHEDAGRTR